MVRGKNLKQIEENMNEDAKIVNYELAYRMLVLMCAATVERNGGVQVDMAQAHTILGVSRAELTATFESLCMDGIVSEFPNGDIVVG
jgi:predicted TIM-barrel fold metal-dependent hydrolase